MGDRFFDFYKPLLTEQKLEDTIFTALDFETTGLYPGTDRIIEVGILNFNLKGEIYEYQSFIDPGRLIPSESSRISGITDEMVAGAPGMKDVIDTIFDHLKDNLVIAHNINFDYSFLKKEAENLNLEYSLEYGIDTVSLARRALKGHRSYSLQNLSQDLGFPLENAHRALDDARLCKLLFLECLSKIPSSGTITVRDLFLYSNTRLK